MSELSVALSGRARRDAWRTHAPPEPLGRGGGCSAGRDYRLPGLPGTAAMKRDRAAPIHRDSLSLFCSPAHLENMRAKCTAMAFRPPTSAINYQAYWTGP